MTVEIAAVFGRVGPERGAALERVLRSFPELARGELTSADIGYRRSLRSVAVLLRFAECSPGTRERIAFQAAREGGWARPLGEMRADEVRAFHEGLEGSEIACRQVEPGRYGAAVRATLCAAGMALEPAAVERPVPGLARVRLAPEAEGAATFGARAHARRVLVVDDDALARCMLSDAFERLGFEVLGAPDVSTALAILTEELLSLDLLVTDLRMPQLSGADLVETIRRLGGETDLPIVVVTASADPTLVATLRSAGANRVLSKGIGAERIAELGAAALHDQDRPVAAAV